MTISADSASPGEAMAAGRSGFQTRR